MHQLRPYQEQLIHDVRLAIAAGHKRIIVQLATGGGKSVIIRDIVKGVIAKQRRAGAIAHRNELIRQLEKHIIKAGIDHDKIGRIQAEYNADYSRPVQICSVQTLDNRELPELDVVIWDEAHHCMASTYRGIIEQYPNAVHLGFTATPCRGDGKGLGDLFQYMVHGPSVEWLIGADRPADQRYLASYAMYSGQAPDLSGIRTGAGGDFNLQELGEAVDDADLIGDAVEAWQHRVQGQANERTIGFCVTRHHARTVAENFQEAGIAADWVDSKMSIEERQRKIVSYIKGETVYLASVGIFTEGFDLSTYAELYDLDDCDIAAVQILRPTRSLALYLQMVGRALRPAGIGKVAIILDHANAQHIHGLPDDPHVWSLEGVRRRSRREAAAEAEAEQQRIERESRLVPVTDRSGVLVKVDPHEKVGRFAAAIPHIGEKEAWKRFLRLEPTLKEVLRAANFLSILRSSKWLYHQWVQGKEHLINLDDLEELKAIARELGFHWKWSEHERERLLNVRRQSEPVTDPEPSRPVVMRVIPGVRER